MKKAILIVIVVGMLSWTVYEFAFSPDETIEKTLEEEANTISENSISAPPKDDGEEVVESDGFGLDKGQMAPDFELTTLDGEKVKLSDFRGEKVMLNFWATWCPPCRAEMPDMQKLHENKDVQILAVNLTESETVPDKIQKFVDELELTFTIPLDEETSVADKYQIQPIPSSFMIDSNGRIQNKAFGALNYGLMVQEFEKME